MSEGGCAQVRTAAGPGLRAHFLRRAPAAKLGLSRPLRAPPPHLDSQDSVSVLGPVRAPAVATDSSSGQPGLSSHHETMSGT